MPQMHQTGALGNSEKEANNLLAVVDTVGSCQSGSLVGHSAKLERVSISGSGEDEVIPMAPCLPPCSSSRLDGGPPRGWAVLDPSLHYTHMQLFLRT